MNSDFLLASAHHLALLLMVAVLAGEAVLLRQTVQEPVLRILGRLDLFYGLSAAALLLFGGARLGASPKGILFYSDNWVFWLKLAVFGLIGLMSIVPTVRFIRWRRAFAAHGTLPDEAVWRSTRFWVMAQLHLLPVVAVAAAAMARGLGH